MTSTWKHIFRWFQGVRYYRRLSLCIFTFAIVTGLGSNAQSPLLVFNNPDYDQFFSAVSNRGDFAILNFPTETHDHINNYHTSYTTQLLITQDGGVTKTHIIDSTSFPGFGPALRHMLVRNDTVYHFGGLYSMDNTVHRMLIRKTDLNLNVLEDVEFNFGNRLLSVSDVAFQGDDMLVSGWVASDSAGHGFILRIDNQMNIQDSIFFPFPMVYWFTFAMHQASDDFLRLFVTSSITHYGLLLRFQKSPLLFLDTLSSYGVTSHHAGQMTNAYGVRLNDSVVLSPHELIPPFKPDSIIKEVGWLKWDLYGNILDTLRPHKDTVIAGRIGHDKPMVIYQDTIAMLYSHDNDWLQYPPSDSTKVAIIFADLQGNQIKTRYLGTGYWFCVENLIRFNNGNYLATARGQSFANWPMISTNYLFVWLLNSQGDVIQSTKIPIKYSDSFISMYPNPASSEINFSLDHDMENISMIELYDMQGQRVAIQHTNNTISTLHIAHLPNGIYIAKLTIGQRVITRKVVKQ